MSFCQLCGIPLKGRQLKFCCRGHKDGWWNQKRKAEMKGFKIIADALEEAGFQVCPLPVDQDPSRIK